MVHGRRVKIVIATLGAVALLGGCTSKESGDEGTATSLPETLSDVEPVVLTYAEFDAQDGINAVAMGAWMDEVTENTDGKVTFESFYNSSLLPPAELITGLSSGLADIGLIYPSIAPEQLPVGLWFGEVDEVTLPTDYPSVVLSGPAASVHRVFSDGHMRAELDELNLVPLSSAQFIPPPPLLCSQPVATPTEAEGVTVRVGGQPWVDQVSWLGMSPVNIPTPELYEAFQRGIAECVLTSPSTFVRNGILEIGTHLTLLDYGAIGGPMMGFNKDSWEALPLATQQIMWDAIPAIYVEYAKGVIDDHQAVIEVAEANGVDVLDGAEINRALRGYREERTASLVSKAPAGVSDPEGVIAEFEAALTAADSIVTDELGLVPAAGFDELLAAYANGSEGIDWGRYRESVAEQLAPYRPAE